MGKHYGLTCLTMFNCMMFCSCAEELAAYVTAIGTGQSHINPGTFLKVSVSFPDGVFFFVSTF
ncbi:hypothetical protein KC19_1G090100 [Ceratodon purpureus]|uniref:Uncharacterized protein n=1 Tax=Ceratodon purpureus TaxID=3225 RepID=A0A8T0J462_CERPU|nr:hypothetical protein KC19_1G090100 [Ceratodon purpureus]